jgi:hypothetical protein
MTIFTIVGPVDLRTFNENCAKHNLDRQKVVFIFPGNSSHHTSQATLFSIKQGGGLAHAATILGTAGYPTLSLPTTSMEQWQTNAAQQQIVETAIQDLYRAVGAGYELMLPVRKPKNTKYFPRPLTFTGNKFEPSFWGGIQTANNNPLATHYVNSLEELAAFISNIKENKNPTLTTNPYYAYYLEGKKRLNAYDPWLQPLGISKKNAATKSPIISKEINGDSYILNKKSKLQFALILTAFALTTGVTFILIMQILPLITALILSVTTGVVAGYLTHSLFNYQQEKHSDNTTNVSPESADNAFYY